MDTIQTLTLRKIWGACCFVVLASACSSDNSTTPEVDPSPPTLSERLISTINTADSAGIAAFVLPDSDDFANIPQDPNNPLSEEKVVLGKMLFHETALATKGVNDNMPGTWSCASCHHADAGFKSGIPQGVGEGGSGFGIAGEARVFASGFDKQADDPAMVPDVQPVTSPSILNTAYQEVMLWNGQFGNMQGGIVNAGLQQSVLATPDTPKAENVRQLAGLEIQAIAGTTVHRMKTSEDSILQTNDEYQMLFDAAYPQVSGTVADADARGRGGFTGEAEDDYKFKVPQLYNLADSNIFGHGASFRSLRDVVAYKNAAVPQKILREGQIDARFVPLGLSEEEMDLLTQFLSTALHDPDLARYKPHALPSGACFPVADEQAKLDLNCN